jgi:hypothetical protein
MTIRINALVIQSSGHCGAVLVDARQYLVHIALRKCFNLTELLTSVLVSYKIDSHKAVSRSCPTD